MDPTVGPVTQVFGAFPNWAHQLVTGHLGRDQGAKTGTPIVAIADGIITHADWGHRMGAALCQKYMMILGNPNSGIVVHVDHDGWSSLSAHMSRTDRNAGERVRRGDIIGYVGTTGLSTGDHLHYETMLVPAPNSQAQRYGRYNPQLQIDQEDRLAAVTALAGNERISGPNPAFMRPEPRTSDVVVREIPPNHKEVFTGYVIGQEVSIGGVTSAVWYQDNGDDGNGPPRFVWAGMFTSQATAGLTNRTPAPPAALKVNQRRVGPTAAAVMRSLPTLEEHTKTGRLAQPNTVENFTHWGRGEAVNLGGVNTDLWYRDSAEWAWSGSFTEQKVDGLLEYTAPVPVTPPATDKPPVAYTFAKSIDAVTEVRPAKEGFFQRGNFPASPAGIVLHEYNAAEVADDPITNHLTVHIESVINAFTVSSRVASAHFAVEGLRGVQFVHHTDRAYHGGPEGNELLSIEIYGGMDKATVATVVRFIVQLEDLFKKPFPLSRHRDHAATKCGAHVDIPMFERLVAAARTPAPAPVPTPVPVPEVPASVTLIGELTALVNRYTIGKK